MTELMQAAVFHGPGDVRIESHAIANVVPGSVLLSVRACTVCGSDLRIASEGNPRIVPPRILGHEIAGEVVAVGAGVSHVAIGDRVAVGADVPCGRCAHCLADRANCCDINFAMGYQFDGGFAEYLLLDPLVVNGGPMRRFPASIPWEHAAVAEPLGCCINGYERALMQPGNSVVVFGAGPIGLMLLMLGQRAYGASQVIMIEPVAARRAAAERFGATAVIDPTTTDPIDAVMTLTGGNGADTIFTANPVVKTHEQAVAVVAKRGVVNLFGGVPKSAPPIHVLSNRIHYAEAYVTGSHGATPAQHAQALDLIVNGTLDVGPLITHRVTLAQLHEGFAAARRGDAIKVAVLPNG